MPWIRGDKLPERLRSAVLRAYVYRMTHEARRAFPEATAQMLRGGYRLDPVSDADWLASKAFYVTRRGELSARHRFCISAEQGALANKEKGMHNAAL